MRLYNLPSAEPRIKVIDGKRLGIKTYDRDNLYPQRMISLINASSTAKAAVELLAKFIKGTGFTQKALLKAKVNPANLTANKLLRRLAKDKAQFRGFAFHVNWTAMYKIASIYYVPFENCRFGTDDYEGMIALHSDWDSYKSGRFVNKEQIEFLNRYNPDPAEIERQVNDAGGWEFYKGQIYYYSDDFESYPLASCDPVVEPIKAEIESDRTTTSNLRNNFTAKSIITNIGKFDDDEERQEFINGVKTFVGPDGEQVMIAEADSMEGAPVVIPITNNLNDKIFEYTDKKVTSKIIQFYNQPSILHSIMDVKSFNVQQMSDSMAYYNGVTSDERTLMSEVFEDVFRNFQIDLNPTGDYSIIPLSYDVPVPETKTVTIDENNAPAAANN